MLAAALLALTMMPVTMTGCGGPTCGSGTTENDSGECVPEADAVTCADGTTLSEGTCVLDTTGCGTNTVLQGGVCVPAETLCANGTTFNTTTSECEAAQECGAGTAANDAGECVPAAGACAAGTTLNGDGICEVATAACGAGTQLDAATGLCALTDTVCGDNTVFANGSCTIIADACTTGTIFNEGTGTCTPEATCKPGDAISGGLCVTPAEKLFADATVGGSLYALPDFAVDTPSLLRELHRRHSGATFKIDAANLAFDRDTDGKLNAVSWGAGVSLQAQRFIFCAGKGNQDLIDLARLSKPASQLRPLKMVWLKKAALGALYAHCIGEDFSMTPRLTVTTHPIPDGRDVWYLGGELAEAGVGVPDHELIERARCLLADIFPSVSYTHLTLPTIYSV